MDLLFELKIELLFELLFELKIDVHLCFKFIDFFQLFSIIIYSKIFFLLDEHSEHSEHWLTVLPFKHF